MKDFKAESELEIKGVPEPKPQSTKAHTSSIKATAAYLFNIIDTVLLFRRRLSAKRKTVGFIISAVVADVEMDRGRSSLPPTAERQTEDRRFHITSVVVADVPLLPPT
uniref:Uncharacterized protein n=1 Tax=Ananas comosus var. bracteatus TaxID=296719 RepID=A0A6V7NSU0_ANACO|nr:unnamed protein product [Ananas comosus var. bracteatus]